MCIGTRWIPQAAYTLSREAERSTGPAFKYHVLNYPTNTLISLFLRQPDDCRSRMTPTIWDILSRRIRPLYSNVWTPPQPKTAEPIPFRSNHSFIACKIIYGEHISLQPCQSSNKKAGLQ